MFLNLTHKADEKAVLINIALVRYIYPMADGCDLIFDPHLLVSVPEGPAEIEQLLAAARNRKKRAPKVRTPNLDTALQAVEAAAKGTSR